MRRVVKSLRRVAVTLSLVGVAYVFMRFEFTTEPPGLGLVAYDVDAAPRIIVDRRPRPLVPDDFVVFSDENGARLLGRVIRVEGDELTLRAPDPTSDAERSVAREFVRGRVVMTFEAAP